MLRIYKSVLYKARKFCFSKLLLKHREKLTWCVYWSTEDLSRTKIGLNSLLIIGLKNSFQHRLAYRKSHAVRWKHWILAVDNISKFCLLVITIGFTRTVDQKADFRRHARLYEESLECQYQVFEWPNFKNALYTWGLLRGPRMTSLTYIFILDSVFGYLFDQMFGLLITPE